MNKKAHTNILKMAFIVCISGIVLGTLYAFLIEHLTLKEYLGIVSKGLIYGILFSIVLFGSIMLYGYLEDKTGGWNERHKNWYDNNELEGDDYYYVFESFEKAMKFCKTTSNAESVPLIAYDGYEFNIFERS